MPKGKLVIQEWLASITFMQQSVLLSAIRGPDGIHKNHVSKKLIRWLRRCILYTAFENTILTRPYDARERQGGSFTGPSLPPGLPACYKNDNVPWGDLMQEVVSEYMLTLDEIPHHFQLHFMHAAEILGYKHPDQKIRDWWRVTYNRLVNDMHLFPESEQEMDRRLSDGELEWRKREEVRAD